MQETTFTEFRNHAKHYFDKVEQGETIRIYRHGRPVGDLVPVPTRAPAWKTPPKTRICIKGLQLSEEIIADRSSWISC